MKIRLIVYENLVINYSVVGLAIRKIRYQVSRLKRKEFSFFFNPLRSTNVFSKCNACIFNIPSLCVTVWKCIEAIGAGGNIRLPKS